MKIEKVRIQNFRSINDSNEVNIDDKITSLIGKNDHGKTNFLKALEFFNKEYKYAEDDLCSYSEKEGIEAKDIEIIAIWFGISNEDKDKLKEIDENLTKINKLKITKYFDNHYSIEVEGQKIEDLEQSTKNIEEIVEKIKSQVDALSEKIKSHIQRYEPFASSKPQYDQFISDFLSAEFDDISQVNQVFSTLYTNLRSLPNPDAPIQDDIENAIVELEKTKNELTTENQKNIKEEILKGLPNFIYFDSIDLLQDSITIDEYLANTAKYKTFTNLFELAKLKVDELKERPFYKRRFATDEASANITGMVNESWKQEEVKVNIGCDGDNLFVYIEDKVGAHDPPSKRSDGFQWFLSFYINFMAGTKGEFKDAILLLDNPGVLLHPSGQKVSLLNTLDKIAKNNQIMFTTHSPFLIDRNHIDRIRIVEKREDRVGTTIKEKFHDSNFDALEPIRAAIGTTIGDSLFGNKKNLIVEGWSDDLILDGISYYLKRTNRDFIDTSKIAIIPVGGAKKTPYFALILWKEGYEFVILLDNDNEGRKVATELKDKYSIEEDRIIKLDGIVSEEMKGIDIEIEDFIDPSFYNKAVNEAYKGLLIEKLGKEEIQLEDLNNLKSMQAKKYEDFFKKNRKLGRFDKIIAAKQIRNIVSDVSCTDDILGETTIKNFEKLFKTLNEKLK